MARSDTESDPKEYKIPAALLATGFLIEIVRAVYFSKGTSLGSAVLALGILLLIQVTLGVLACLLAGKIVGASYGYLIPGCCKLAAIFVFPGAIALCIPWACVGWVVCLFLYWGLIQWLFGLDPLETIVTVIVIWVVNAGAVFVAIAAADAAHG